jgi:hypothetical protein
MLTASGLKRRLEVLERSLPGPQETKIFFIDGSSEALFAPQWKAVRTWEQSHPSEQAHIIVFEEF